MSQVELRQRVREQKAAQIEQVLKYRGVSYIKKSPYVNGIQIWSGGEGC
jgi:predicted mannosyl-3-phosphoglycerate phosphatase (HAD superfamily)